MIILPNSCPKKKPQGFAIGDGLRYFLMFFFSLVFTTASFAQTNVSEDTLHSSSSSSSGVSEIVLSGEAKIISVDRDFNQQVLDRKIIVRNSRVPEKLSESGLLVISAAPEVSEKTRENTLEKQQERHLAEIRKIAEKLKENARENPFFIQNGELAHLSAGYSGSAYQGVLFIPNLLFIHSPQLSFIAQQNHYYARRFYCGPMLSVLECLNSRLFARPPPAHV